MVKHLEDPERLSTIKLLSSGETGVTAGVVFGPRAPTAPFDQALCNILKNPTYKQIGHHSGLSEI